MAQTAPRFVRRTTLNENEYRVNFKQIDNDVIKALTSTEAREVTPLMATIYLTLLAAPQDCWERAGVLHFMGEDREEGHLTAWERMRKITGVANSTLSKALDWMRKTGVIGYDARANGVGIRVFINRAASSIREGIRESARQGREGAQSVRQGIGRGPGQQEGQGRGQQEGQGSDRPTQKNLRILPTPSAGVPTPISGAPFKEYGVEKNSEKYFPRAFARIDGVSIESGPDGEFPKTPSAITSQRTGPQAGEKFQNGEPDQATAIKSIVATQTHPDFEFLRSQHACEIDSKLVTTLTRRIASELRPEILTAVKRETEDAREWFIKYGLPKATRVAQRETYDLLRAQGVIATKKSSADVGRYDRTSGEGREGNREIERITAFLAESGEAIRRAAANAEVSGKRELRIALWDVGRELDTLRDQFNAGEQVAPDETENRLAALEDRIRGAIWESTDDSELDGILKSAREDLKEYASRMDAGAFDETVRRRATARLREQYEIPRISLFYS